MSAEKIVGLGKHGDIVLANGKLACLDEHGVEIGRIYIGPNGKLVVDGIEILGTQKDDPWKITGAISHASMNKGALVLACGETRADGVVEETGFVKLGRCEDASPTDYAGQCEIHLRLPGASEPTLVAVASSAYSDGDDGELFFFKARTLYLAARHFLSSLWKFHAPLPARVAPAPPTEPGNDLTNGTPFNRGDWDSLERYYGFESDDHEHYASDAMTWAQVVAEMERRNG